MAYILFLVPMLLTGVAVLIASLSVVVDYLQMMAEDSGGNRSYELGDVARGLYKMAGELDVPVLALSQISKGVEGRQNKRPIREILTLLSLLTLPEIGARLLRLRL